MVEINDLCTNDTYIYIYIYTEREFEEYILIYRNLHVDYMKL